MIGDAISLHRSSGSLRILAVLNELHMAYKDVTEGDVAHYIPELSKVSPDLFAISVFTVTGEAFDIGESNHQFTLQSLAHPFVYGMILDDLGRDRVLQTVGVEPTGNPFHAIVLDRKSNLPMNPMVNAGAIAVSAMIHGTDATDRLNRMLTALGGFMGRRPSVDMEAFMSEKGTSDRNRSIAYLMRNFGVLEREIEETLDLYIQQCAVSVSTSELALMAATLANGGVNPKTGQRAISQRSMRDVLTIMFTCGLYESSGQWVHSVGIPAKSGVSGGFMAVVPGRLGIGIYSPRVDASGASVRGQLVCKDLSRLLNLHVFQHGDREVSTRHLPNSRCCGDA